LFFHHHTITASCKWKSHYETAELTDHLAPWYKIFFEQLLCFQLVKKFPDLQKRKIKKNAHKILVLMFSRLEFSEQLRLLGMSRVECCRLSTVSANISVAIFRGF
jgi:hypothetical protein